jgi:hypothetical protein
MEHVRAKLVQNDCPECFHALLEESRSLEWVTLVGEVVLIPEHWLNPVCTHGRLGIKFERLPDDTDEPGSPRLAGQAFDTRMDATKNIGYPAREQGTYGSHPMHDDFNDESNPDGSGSYPGVKRR